jgi:hypothetical protein
LNACSLYIPFINLKINDQKGEKILYENLVQSGPAYTLVVHESPAWLEIRDKMPWPEMIKVISKERAEEYKELVRRFFSPISEAVPYYIGKDGQKYPIDNLATDLRRALSYVLIAHDYKARIFEDDILEIPNLSEMLMKSDVFSDEAIKSAQFVENLIAGYKKDCIEALSVNQDARVFNDLMKLLREEEVRALSEKNSLFGVVIAKKNILKIEIQELLTKIVRNEWFPYLTKGAVISLCYYASLENMMAPLILLSDIGTKVLSKYDFKQYAPPIQDPKLFRFAAKETIGFFSYEPFNYEVKIFVPPRV